MKNAKLYNASMALIQAARYIKEIDKDFAQKLLDKAEGYKNQIVIDKKLEAEVINFEEKIKQG